MVASESDDTIVPPSSGRSDAKQSELGAAGTRVGQERPGDQIGPYKLVSLIGEGGMGEVWLADRREPYEQRVALKLIKAGMDSKSVLARFEQERQALAVMSHPGIAKVLDGGLTPSGRPYFAMECVKGEPLTAFCDRVKLGIEDRLRLFAQACEAVQHAHLKGIVHRDLKPSNILAFMVEGEGPKLKVIDFGVSKAMSRRMSELTIFTETGQMIGTPEYMSPEQADPTFVDIDTRSDIYSLGVLLYELLAGATPFDPGELRKKAYGEIQRTLREQDPPTPSARLSTLATRDRESASRIEAARRLRTDDLVRRLRGELEWIPLKAMRKEPQLRYQTAMSLAEDVRNYLEGKPLIAAPESVGYRMRKIVKRHRALALGAGAVLAALVFGLGLATWQWFEADRARSAALASEQRALAEKSQADTARAAAVTSAADAAAQLEQARDLLAVVAMGTALEAARESDPGQVRNEFAKLSTVGRADRFPMQLALAICDQSIGGALRGHTDVAHGVAYSPDGKTLASASYDKTVRLWDAATGRALVEPMTGHEGQIVDLEFSPDGRKLVSASFDGTVRLWDATTGQQIGEPLRGHDGAVCSATFSPDGQTLASGGTDKTIRLWDVTTLKQIGEPLRGFTNTVAAVDFSSDGDVLASGGWDGTVRMWDAATGQQLGEPLHGHEGQINSVEFSPDGKTVASAGWDKSVRLWDALTGKAIGSPLLGHASNVTDVSFSPDGRRLVSAGWDRTNRLWDVATGKQLGDPMRGHSGWVTRVAFSPDGQALASSSSDRTIRLWSAANEQYVGAPLLGHERAVYSVAFSPDGRTLATASIDDTIRLWDAVSGRTIGTPLRGHLGAVAGVAFSPDGKLLATAGFDRTVRLWDALSGKMLGEPLLGHAGTVYCVAFSPDGKTLASASEDRTIRLWDSRTGQALGGPLLGHEGGVSGVAFSPDGSVLASASRDQTIRLWNSIDGTAIGDPLRGHGWVTCLAFSPNGRLLASGSFDNSVRLWDAKSGQPIGTPLRGHTGSVHGVTFCTDGKTLASAGADETVRLWDLVTGEQVGKPLRGHDGVVHSVAFKPDGTALASAGADGTIRVWDAVPLGLRFGAVSQRLAQAAQVREALSGQIAAVGPGQADVDAFQAAVLADSRFAGELRVSAMIVVGEVDQARAAARALERTAREARLQALNLAYSSQDWASALQLVEQASSDDAASFSAIFWNDIAWGGLIALPVDSPARDLKRLLAYAQRAVELTHHKNGGVLDTLARADWELGDKARAIEVQREALSAAAGALGATPTDEARVMHAAIEATLRLYEQLPAGAPLPGEAN